MKYTNSPQPTSKIQIDWAFFRNLPIEEVCDVLGIRVEKGGWFLCPAHDDKDPSAKISKSGTSWTCFSCGAGGTAIDLCMHAMNIKKANEACLYLGKFFKEGLKNREDAEMGEKIGLIPPQLTSECYRDIGLSHNPFHNKILRGIIGERQSKTGKTETKYEKVAFLLEQEDAADLVVEKATETIARKQMEVQGVFKMAPNLPQETKEYIASCLYEALKPYWEIVSRFEAYKEELVAYEDRLMEGNEEVSLADIEKMLGGDEYER